MKRLTWILMAVLCAAFVRVQPVGMGQSPCCASCHCKVPGSCGMPGCAQSPASPTLAAGQGSLVSKTVAKTVRVSLPAASPFYAPFVGRPARPFALIASALAVPAGSVPLFKAHCSFLV